MEYLKIIEEVISIMKYDYVGFQIKEGWANHEELRNKAVQLEGEGKLNRQTLVEIISDYLIEYKDHHVGFFDMNNKKAQKRIEFRVRRFEDSLYVTSTNGSSNVKLGDQIIELDGLTIVEVAKKRKRELEERSLDRQFWAGIVAKHKTLTILRDGKKINVDIKVQERVDHVSKYSFKDIDEETSYLLFNDFQDMEQMTSLIDMHKEKLCRKNIIIDVRYNLGGCDTVFYPLFDYIFPENTCLASGVVQYHNMTTRNYNNRIDDLENIVKENPGNKMIEDVVNAYKQRKDKGLCTLGDAEDTMEIKGSSKPEKVIILSDKYTSSSGDMICILSKTSSKVTQVGRPTFGVIDYGNIAFEDFGDGLKLMYSTSFNEWTDNKEGYDLTGVEPDVLIPWTPEHIKKDLDLELALELLAK